MLVEILSRLAIFERLLLLESITASAAPEVLPHRCKGMREYVCKPTPFPLARDTAGARKCGAIYVLSLLDNLTLASSCCGTVDNLLLLLTAVDFFVLTLVPLDV